MKLQWYDKLYISDDMKKNRKKTMNAIRRRKLAPGVYLLTLPTNEQNLMDIVPAWLLLQKAYYRRCPMIIGMARGEEDAYELAEKIIMETYENTGAFQVGEYLKDR